MGMHIGLVAVKTSSAQFSEIFSHVWTNYEVVTTADKFNDANAMWAWKETNEKFVSAADWSKDNPGKEVYFFWQDGPWATMMDESYTLAADEENLKILSSQVGTVLSFIVETAGGCAFFMCFENGILRRKISNNDSEITTEGDPLPEETGIDTSNYYMNETESLLKAFGLSPINEMPLSEGCRAICVTDRTDYEYLKTNIANEQKSYEMNNDASPNNPNVSSSKKPWWKLW